jgi:hypothetical protein
MRYSESAVQRKLLGQYHAGDLVQAGSAVLLRNPAAHQAELCRFLHQRRHQARLLILQVLDMREDLFDHKLFRGLADQPLIVIHVRRRKNFLR